MQYVLDGIFTFALFALPVLVGPGGAGVVSAMQSRGKISAKAAFWLVPTFLAGGVASFLPMALLAGDLSWCLGLFALAIAVGLLALGGQTLGLMASAGGRSFPQIWADMDTAAQEWEAQRLAQQRRV